MLRNVEKHSIQYIHTHTHIHTHILYIHIQIKLSISVMPDTYYLAFMSISAHPDGTTLSRQYRQRQHKDTKHITIHNKQHDTHR